MPPPLVTCLRRPIRPHPPRFWPVRCRYRSRRFATTAAVVALAATRRGGAAVAPGTLEEQWGAHHCYGSACGSACANVTGGGCSATAAGSAADAAVAATTCCWRNESTSVACDAAVAGAATATAAGASMRCVGFDLREFWRDDLVVTSFPPAAYRTDMPWLLELRLSPWRVGASSARNGERPEAYVTRTVLIETAGRPEGRAAVAWHRHVGSRGGGASDRFCGASVGGWLVGGVWWGLVFFRYITLSSVARDSPTYFPRYPKYVKTCAKDRIFERCVRNSKLNEERPCDHCDLAECCVGRDSGGGVVALLIVAIILAVLLAPVTVYAVCRTCLKGHPRAQSKVQPGRGKNGRIGRARTGSYRT